MPVSVVVGGQYGSEGKGKVTHWLARKQQARYAVRVGGPNSGHTVVEDGRRTVLRTLPTPILLDGVIGVVPAGAYLDVDVLLREVEETGLAKDRLLIHPSAVVIDDSMREEERRAGLVEGIGSTGQGVGTAVAQRAMRRTSVTFAGSMTSLRRFVRPDLDRILAGALDRGERVIVEGTQGFGLSLLHGGHYPYATSRDTTAAGALSEAGLSPRDVDCVALTLRAFPIRVGGNSGPLPLETTWETIEHECGAGIDLTELTTVTGRPRLVARFHEEIVLRAVRANRPDLVVLNHVDYFDYAIHEEPDLTPRVARRVSEFESRLGLRTWRSMRRRAPGECSCRPRRRSCWPVCHACPAIPGSCPAASRARICATSTMPGRSSGRAPGLDDVRIHDLRHSFASRALALGESLPMIGKLLGHGKIETTARYAHLARDSVHESAGRIAESIAADILANR